MYKERRVSEKLNHRIRHSEVRNVPGMWPNSAECADTSECTTPRCGTFLCTVHSNRMEYFAPSGQILGAPIGAKYLGHHLFSIV